MNPRIDEFNVEHSIATGPGCRIKWYIRGSVTVPSPRASTSNPLARLGLAEGEARHDDLEKRLAAVPNITVPTSTLEGEANGAPHAEPAVYAKRFSGNYAHRTIDGGGGHNLPQEAPQALAHAIMDVARF